MGTVHIMLGDWIEEWNEEMQRPGRGYRSDLLVEDLLRFNRGRWRMSAERAAAVDDVLFIHAGRVVAVAVPSGGVEVLHDGRIAWERLDLVAGDPRVGEAVGYRSYGNPIRYV